MLAQVHSLNAVLATLDASLALEKFTADKKHDHTHYWIIAPNADGYLQRIALPKTDASRARIRELFIMAKAL